MAASTRILKFGGTSVGTAETLARAVAIVVEAARRHRPVVVVSALHGVTDALVSAGERAAQGDPGGRDLTRALRERHQALLAAIAPGREGARAGLAIDARLAEMEERLQTIAAGGGAALAGRDAVLATGERLAAPIVVAALEARGLRAEAIDGTELLVTDGGHGDAAVDLGATAARAARRLATVVDGVVPVVTGFVGATPAGITTTLGRGGSDYTAAVRGRVLGASRVEIWTDGAGIATADPRLVPEARPLPRLGYAEAAALSAAGAKVLHPDTVAPLAAAGIPILIHDARQPSAPGTLVGDLDEPALGAAIAVAPRPHPHGHEVLVSIVGDDAILAGLAAGAAGQALAAAGLSGVTLAHGHGPRRLTASVPAADGARAARALHAAFVSRPCLNLVLAGPRGRVARALRARLPGGGHGVEVRLVGALTREHFAWDPAGIADGALDAALGGAGPADWPRVWGTLRASRLRPLVFVDCTASEALPDRYESLLAAGIAVATPNKRGGILPYRDWARLRALDETGAAPYLRGTTVGAGLPILDTVRRLRRGGRGLRSVSAVLSGTLSFVLDRVQDGAAFSRAVEEAHALGLTEPDPREDLCGADVARKLLVVLREADLVLEGDDIPVASLVSPAAAQAGRDGLVAALAREDEAWAARAAQARVAGERLAFLASHDEAGPRVGLASLPAGDPLARVRPGDSAAVLRTVDEPERLITLAGPGAGPDVTAANLWGEILEACGPACWRSRPAVAEPVVAPAEARAAGAPAAAGLGGAGGRKK
jgi:bifunctional aspartokinase / homoserine dehydrogenase 1